MNRFSEVQSQWLMPVRPKHRYPPQKKSLDFGSLASSGVSIGASSIGNWDNATVTSTSSTLDRLEKRRCSEDLVLVDAEGSAFKVLVERRQADLLLGRQQESISTAYPGSSRPTTQKALIIPNADPFPQSKGTAAAATPVSTSLGASGPSSSGALISNAYSALEYCGVFAHAPPFNYIRVWKSTSDHTQIAYDCICNARLPGTSLRNIKRHVYRHCSAYICPVCKQEFRNHWSFNAHQKIHPVRSPSDITASFQ